MQGWEFIVVAVAVVLLLGASRLPKIARSVGEARRELEKVRAENDDAPDSPAEAAARPTPPAAVASVVDAAPLPPPLPPPAP